VTPPLPVALSLGTEGSILVEGRSLLLTLRVESLASAESASAPLAVDVTLLLPPGVVTAQGSSGGLGWKGIPIAPGAPFVQTLHLQMDAVTAGEAQVVAVTATAAAAGYETISAQTLLGVMAGSARAPADGAAPVAIAGEGGAAVTSADGEVVLLAPAGVLPTGATVQMTELFDGLAALEAVTPTIVAPAETTATPVLTASPQAATAIPANEPVATEIVAAELIDAGRDGAGVSVAPALEITETPMTAAPVSSDPAPATDVLTTTAAPVVTDTPVVTDAPVVTDTAAVTATPAVTDTPVVTDTPAVTDTPVVTDTPSFSLGALSPEAAAVATRQEANVRIMRMWQLDAVTGGADARQEATFSGEVLLRVSVAEWLALGVDPLLLRLWTRESAGEGWTPVPSVLRREAGVLEAFLPHFSQFGLGAGLDTSGDSPPSVKAFTVDALNGGANLHIPVEAPAGLRGLSPDLSFNYSSIGLDDLLRTGGEHLVQAQASGVGLGWSLGGVSYIARADAATFDKPDAEKEFALVLGGERVSIVLQGGRWRTNPETFARIEWHNVGTGSDHDSGEAEDFASWSVFTPDGLRYDFGDPGVFSGAFVGYSPTMTVLAKNASGQEDIRLAKRWYLRRVSDTLGNGMLYNYQAEQGWEDGCVSEAWKNDGKNWYTRSTDLTQVLWNGHTDPLNPSLNLGYMLRIDLTYATRTDTQIEGSGASDCIQPLYGTANRLVDVAV